MLSLPFLHWACGTNEKNTYLFLCTYKVALELSCLQTIGIKDLDFEIMRVFFILKLILQSEPELFPPSAKLLIYLVCDKKKI